MVPAWMTAEAIAHVQVLLSSFRHWLGYDLLTTLSPDPTTAAQQVFEAPFALLSHGTQSDPILNYGNQTALRLWEMDWADFTQMPSRLTAEVDLRADRSQQLARAAQQGYLRGYEGIRISKTGQRFQIREAVIWKVLDEQGQPCGQAATFAHWHSLDSSEN